MRSPQAQSIEKDIEEGKTDDRVQYFYFGYNWETREKEVFLFEDQKDLETQKKFSDSVFEDHKWHRTYKVEVTLPFPAIADSREVIEVVAPEPWEEKDWRKPGESVLLAFARRLWAKASKCFPSPWEPIPSSIWQGVCETGASPAYQFQLERGGKKYRVTVKELP